MVNAGCFNQVEEPVIDFSKYTRIETGRKFRGLYNLYQNNETMELVFICPLVENNKGDVDEKKNMAPYAYDCIITEAMNSFACSFFSSRANFLLTPSTGKRSVRILEKATVFTDIGSPKASVSRHLSSACNTCVLRE